MKTTSIKFGKTNLQNLKHHETVKQNDGKLLYNFPKKYFASNCQGLCLFVYPKPSVKKAFYAAWSIEKYDPKTGLSKRYGRYKYICDLGQKPLDWVIDHVNQNLKQWKQEKQSTKSKRTVGGLAAQFIKFGLGGYRVKSKGAKIKYKNKTSAGYAQVLKTYVLLQTKKTKIVSLLTDPFQYNGSGFVTGALKDISLHKISKRDIEIFHTRLESKPTTANRAVAALSVAFEWDMKRSVDRMFPGDTNPCLRVSKYQEKKDKNFLNLNKVIEIRTYLTEEQWRDPHFNTFYLLCLEIGERLEDTYRLMWHRPKDQKDLERCSGWIDWDKRIVHLTDSKDRKSADVHLTIEAFDALQKLMNWRTEDRCSWAIQSPWIFPRITDPSLPINKDSYRVKLQKFHVKFGLGRVVNVQSEKRGERKYKSRKRKKHKYILDYTFKHLRKTFVTHYGRDEGLEKASFRMRHSSTKVTKEHYFTEDQEALKKDHMYSSNVVKIKKKEYN
tara:strand:- start:417 stop:1910 length:1494 start_codon:yes stop_codon:yes gene_type:complete